LKIHLLLTGGTIGISTDDPVLKISEDKAPKLFSDFKSKRSDNDIHFSCETLFNILSENMTMSNWKLIYNKVKTISKADCDGIIITHGTDTLAYTAAFLAMMLKQSDLPILLISSNYPIDHELSNGLSNFTAAVDFISTVGTKGVFVPFCKNGTTDIHLGTRIMQAQPFSHCFNSLGGIEYGKIENGKFKRTQHTNNPTPEMIENDVTVNIPCFPDEKSILYLKPYLGVDYSVFDFKNNKPDAILHGLYHSGTACVTPVNEKNSIITFAKRCIELGIDFYAAPCDSGHSTYSTSKDMVEVGIKFIKDISCVAAYTKLLIAYGSFSDLNERQKFIESNIACEQFY
jgi:L-asparaginase